MLYFNRMKKPLYFSLVLALIITLAVLIRFFAREPLVETRPEPAPQTLTAFGFIRAIDLRSSKTPALSFDDAVWLVGEEAERAAITAGRCSETKPATSEEYDLEWRLDCTPNGYFIENTDATPHPLTVSPSVEIIMETYETGEPGDKAEHLNLAAFAGLINDQKLYWNQLPYHVTIENGVVIKIVEQYIP